MIGVDPGNWGSSLISLKIFLPLDLCAEFKRICDRNSFLWAKNWKNQQTIYLGLLYIFHTFFKCFYYSCDAFVGADPKRDHFIVEFRNSVDCALWILYFYAWYGFLWSDF